MQWAVAILRQGWDFAHQFCPDPTVVLAQAQTLGQVQEHGQQLLAQYAESLSTLPQHWQGRLASIYRDEAERIVGDLRALIAACEHDQQLHAQWVRHLADIHHYQAAIRDAVTHVAENTPLAVIPGAITDFEYIAAAANSISGNLAMALGIAAMIAIHELAPIEITTSAGIDVTENSAIKGMVYSKGSSGPRHGLLVILTALQLIHGQVEDFHSVAEGLPHGEGREQVTAVQSGPAEGPQQTAEGPSEPETPPEPFNPEVPEKELEEGEAGEGEVSVAGSGDGGDGNGDGDLKIIEGEDGQIIVTLPGTGNGGQSGNSGDPSGGHGIPPRQIPLPGETLPAGNILGGNPPGNRGAKMTLSELGSLIETIPIPEPQSGLINDPIPDLPSGIQITVTPPHIPDVPDGPIPIEPPANILEWLKQKFGNK